MSEGKDMEKEPAGGPRAVPEAPAAPTVSPRPVTMPPKPSGPVIYEVEKGADVWPSTKRS